jgi:hypothetical protein
MFRRLLSISAASLRQDAKTIIVTWNVTKFYFRKAPISLHARAAADTGKRPEPSLIGSAKAGAFAYREIV